MTNHHSTGFTPIELHFGKQPKDEILNIITYPTLTDLSKDAKIMLAKEKIQVNFEKRKRSKGRFSAIELKVGDLVLVSEPKQSDALKRVKRKLFHLYYGPFRISRDLKNNAYELVDMTDPSTIKGIYNLSNLKKYFKRQS